jgi:signal transduction histidine kinase
VSELDNGAGAPAGGWAVDRDPADQARLRQIADEQAALRRVATLVARGAAPEEVFTAVAGEVGQLLPVDQAALCRYEPEGTLTFVSQWGSVTARFPVGSRWILGGRNVGTLVFQTGRPARVDYSARRSSGPLGVGIREAGLRSAIGTPIIVEGRLWGTISVASQREQPLPADTEARLVSFTELVATAIANADSRAELMASRARIVAAADESRRRIERDLHDGTQQPLVTLLLDVEAVQAMAPPELEGELSRIAEQVTDVLDQVREISRGIHPAILSEGGLTLALKALARRSAVPVELDLRTGRRLMDHVEVAAYYAVSEALANAAKHARASAVHVKLDTPDGVRAVWRQARLAAIAYGQLDAGSGGRRIPPGVTRRRRPRPCDAHPEHRLPPDHQTVGRRYPDGDRRRAARRRVRRSARHRPEAAQPQSHGNLPPPRGHRRLARRRRRTASQPDHHLLLRHLRPAPNPRRVRLVAVLRSPAGPLSPN